MFGYGGYCGCILCISIPDTTSNTDPTMNTPEDTKTQCKIIHTNIVQEHLTNRPPNLLQNTVPPPISKTETTPNKTTRRCLAQLRANKSPLLNSYKHKINPIQHPTPNCTVCNRQLLHDTKHLFECPMVDAGNLGVEDLWRNPVEVGRLLETWARAMGWEGFL